MQTSTAAKFADVCTRQWVTLEAAAEANPWSPVCKATLERIRSTIVLAGRGLNSDIRNHEMSWSRLRTLAALAAAISFLICPGARGSPPERYTVDVFTVEDWLPQSSVVSMIQSAEGYLWLGTLGGIARFDGLNSVIFDEGNTPELDSGRIIQLFADSKENLWVATEPGGLLRVHLREAANRSSFRPKEPNSNSRVLAFAEDRSGGVWLYRADGQLACYTDRMRVWEVDRNPPREPRFLAPEASGILWFGGRQRLFGVGPLPVAGDALPYSHTAAGVDFLLASKGPGHWRFSGGEIAYYVTNQVVKRLGAYPWRPGVLVAAACEDKDGDLIVGTYGDPGDGVYWFNKAGVARRVTGLSHDSILSVLVDQDGTLWVGTDGGGLNRVRSQAFSVVGPSAGSTVQSVCADGTNGVWIGYNGPRIDHWTPEGTKQYDISRPSVSLAVRSVYVDKQGRVWAGTRGGGLFRLFAGEFRPVEAYDEVGNQWISSIIEDDRGVLWVGTQGGLAYWDGKFWKTLSSLDGLSGQIVQAIAKGPDGALWVGTDGGGLNRIKDRQVTIYTRQSGLVGDHVFAVLTTGTNEVWVGTSSGLSWFEQGKWHSFTTRNGLAGNSIRFLLDDNEGNLWIGSNAGLTRASKQSLTDVATGITNRAILRHFSKEDGLPTRECSQGSQPAAARTPDGKLWFATIKGLASVLNRDVRTHTNPPPTVIERIIVDGRDLVTNSLSRTVPAAIALPARSESLEIHFAGINLNAPERTRFKYRLEGHETAWTEIRGNTGATRYTRLPPRDYVFTVLSANEEGAWSETGPVLAVTVLPPFWRTWWFLSLVTVFSLGLVVAVVHYFSTQKLQRQLATLRQQEALERERGRIARDLHDQLGANLTQVALLGELAEADKEVPEEVEAHARQISQTARETTHALDEIVWTVNPANDTLDELVNYICKYAQDYLELAGLKYRIEVPADVPPVTITPELRHNAFLVAKEAINNVVKHARAESVWVRLDMTAGRFGLQIEDDGIGLPANAANKGRNGLRNMHSRMADAGGSFSVKPRPEGGTIARLEAPLTNKQQQTP